MQNKILRESGRVVCFVVYQLLKSNVHFCCSFKMSDTVVAVLRFSSVYYDTPTGEYRWEGGFEDGGEFTEDIMSPVEEGDRIYRFLNDPDVDFLSTIPEPQLANALCSDVELSEVPSGAALFVYFNGEGYPPGYYKATKVWGYEIAEGVVKIEIKSIICLF